MTHLPVAPADPLSAGSPLLDTSLERRRLDALRSLNVLDTASEPVFDAITEAAAQVCGVPIALVSLIDADRQWFKSSVGLPGVQQTARGLAFCDHAIRGADLFEIEDARADPRFADNPLVTGDPKIRFYAGTPIVMAGGERIGTVCVIDREPRQLTAVQRNLLGCLGRIASASLTARGQQEATKRELAAGQTRYRAIVEDQNEMISLALPNRVLSFVNSACARHLGLEPRQMVGHDLLEFVAPPDRDAVAANWASVCARTETVHSVNRMMSASNQVRWVAWSNRPLVDDGQVIAVQSVGRDVTDQKLAEIALAESERRFRSLYESTPAILHSVDAEGRLLNVSDLWLQVMGYERDEVIGRRSADFMTPESRQFALDEALPEFFKTGRCEEVEFQFVHKDGSLIDTLLSGVIDTSDATSPRSLAVLQNVTAAKRMADELKRTHERLDAVIENIPALLGHWDHDQVTRFANREFQAAVGLPPERIIGASLEAIFDAIDPVAYEGLAPRVKQVLQGRRQEFELAMLTTSGLRQMRLTLVPDQTQPGRVAGFYAMAYDITGRKALELRLTESELRYRSLFDNLDSGFALHEIVLDEQGRPVDYTFVAMNAAFTRMTGLTPAAAIGRRVTEVVPEIRSDPADWIGVFGRVAQSGEPVHFEQRSAALERWFDVVAYRPTLGQFAVLTRDITQHKQTELQLAQALNPPAS